MKKSLSLAILIGSLSKSEKRYFRLHAGLQNGDKSYLNLFDLYESISPGDIETAFRAKFPGQRFEVASRHLYRVILQALVHLRKHKDVQTQIFQTITQAEILFERGLPDEAYGELAKAEKTAVAYQHDTLLLLVRRTELRFLSARQFRDIGEKELVGKQMRIMDSLKQIRSSNLHTQLYDILKLRFIRKGYARSAARQEALNDLLLQEINLVASASGKGFETEKTHLLFQATYFLNAGNHGAALRYYRRLIDLFAENRLLLNNPPVHYFNAVTGILDSLLATELYTEMPFFTARLEELERGRYPTDFTLTVHAHRYLFESAARLGHGETGRALELESAFEESLFRKQTLLDVELQLRLHVHRAALHLTLGEPDEARRHLKSIFASGKLFSPFPFFRTARLLNLVLQTERQRFDFLDAEIKALQRESRSDAKHTLCYTEKLLFAFLRAHPLPPDRASRENIWQRYAPVAERVRNDKYERSLLTTFDFITWIERRLTAKADSQ